MQKSLYQTAVAEVSLSDSGYRETIYQTAAASDRVSPASDV